MRRLIKYFILSVIGLLLTGCTVLQSIKVVNSGRVAPDSISKSTIPFKLNGHPMFVKVRLNGSKTPYNFMLDTGALTVVSRRVARALKLQSAARVGVGGTGGKKEKVKLVALKRVAVGDLAVQNVGAAVVDFSKMLGDGVDGILGSNFLQFFQVTIDYKRKEITLTKDAKPIPTRAHDIKIAFETSMMDGFAPIIDCVVNGNIRAKAIIDTGTAELAGLPLSLMKKTQSFKEGKVLTAKGSMRGGLFGMAQKSYMTRINSLGIGSLRLSNIPSMSYPEKNHNEYILLGNKFLSKFLVMIDYPAKTIVLRPRKTSFKTNIFSYGLSLQKKDKKTIVSGIWDKSPASKIGIELGDEILKVNAKDTKRMSILDLLMLFRDERRDSLDIVFVHDHRAHKVNLHKAMLLPPLK